MEEQFCVDKFVVSIAREKKSLNSSLPEIRETLEFFFKSMEVAYNFAVSRKQFALAHPEFYSFFSLALYEIKYEFDLKD